MNPTIDETLFRQIVINEKIYMTERIKILLVCLIRKKFGKAIVSDTTIQMLRHYINQLINALPDLKTEIDMQNCLSFAWSDASISLEELNLPMECPWTLEEVLNG